MPSFTEPHSEKSGCVFKSRGKPRLLGSSSGSRYGDRADLVTAVSKESFFFLISTARVCLTPARKEYFVARQRKAPEPQGPEIVTLQRIRSVRLAMEILAAFFCTATWHQFEAARDGFSFAICFTVAASSSASNDGYEQIRLLQANAAGSPRSGYSTSGLGSLPSRGSSHSRRL
jgi:hypothetical protein